MARASVTMAPTREPRGNADEPPAPSLAPGNDIAASARAGVLHRRCERCAAAGRRGAERSAVAAKPIRLVSPFNPGGAIDVLNRVIAEKLSQRLGQQVFVDAVPGANTIKGADVVAKAP